MSYKGFWNKEELQYQVFSRPAARMYSTSSKQEAEEVFKMWISDGPDSWNIDQIVLDKIVNGKRTTIKSHWFRR